MRNVGNKTPTTRQEQKEATSEKLSGKKLVQARLPFKIIAPSSTPTTGVLVESETDGSGGGLEALNSAVGDREVSSINEVRKRKLSYNEVSGTEEKRDEDASPAKENLSTTRSKKKKINSTNTTLMEEGTILLGDTDDDEAEREKEVAKATNVATKIDSSSKTPLNKSQKRKGAGTPKSASASSSCSGGGGTGSAGGGSSTKLQIKLPLSGKKKRRKSQRKSVTAEHSFAESGDDIEVIAAELNPQKRPKVEEKEKCNEAAIAKENYEEKKNVDEKNINAEKMEGNDTNNVTKKSPSKTTNQTIKDTPTKPKDSPKSNVNKRTQQIDSNKNIDSHPIDTINIESDSDNNDSSDKKATSSKRKSLKTLDAFVAKKGTTTKHQSVNNDGIIVESKKHNTRTTLLKTSGDLKPATVGVDDVETDDEDAANSSPSSIDDDDDKKDCKLSVGKDSKVMDSPAPSSPLPGSNVSSKEQLKNLTPKQQRLVEQRKKAREDKERRLQEQKEERDRKLQEERQQKQREKEEKELAKKREREEKEEQKRKEREEKEDVKRKDREEKERKRLAEIEAKNEERRKRTELKEEDLRKKEEERKRKEQEKEDAENKKKKAAEAFTKFFVPKSSQRLKNAGADVEVQKLAVKEGVEKTVSNEALAFRPFQIKGDMQLAPILRKDFSNDARGSLDAFLCDNTKKVSSDKAELYLCELKTGKIQPGKWRRPTVDVKEGDDDVVIVEDELERAAQAIVEEHAVAVERFRAKYLKFHENRRPPYFGTWRKKTNVITPRRPLGQDNKYFDYEVDSDLEWEEEEPGESLNGSDDEKEKESEDDDYEVDNEWFVPHGHLSDEEMQNEDECGLGDDNTREAQKAKLKILQQEFAQEMKKKTEKIKPRLIGCIWQDYNGNQPELCPNIIWNSLNLRAMLCTAAPIIEEPIVTESTNDTVEPNSPTTSTTGGQTDKKKPIVLTETMLKDLIRLVHGNRHKKDFIIKEFIAFVEQTEDSIKKGEVRGPIKSVVREKIDEFALWQIIELNSHSKTKKNKKKLCWLVSEEILKKYDMQNLDLHNTWTYTLQPKFVDAKILHSDKNTPAIAEDSVAETTESVGKRSPTSQQKKIKKKKADVITKFTKVLTSEEKAQQLQQKSKSPKVPHLTKSPMQSKKTEPGNGKHTIADTAAPEVVPSVSTVKKRVPLLMSVARGQQISTPAKNALISQFLRKTKEEANEKGEIVSRSKTQAASSPMEIDEVVVLD